MLGSDLGEPVSRRARVCTEHFELARLFRISLSLYSASIQKVILSISYTSLLQDSFSLGRSFPLMLPLYHMVFLLCSFSYSYPFSSWYSLSPVLSKRRSCEAGTSTKGYLNSNCEVTIVMEATTTPPSADSNIKRYGYTGTRIS